MYAFASVVIQKVMMTQFFLNTHTHEQIIVLIDVINQFEPLEPFELLIY